MLFLTVCCISRIAADLESNLHQTLPVLPNIALSQSTVKVSEGMLSPSQAEALQSSTAVKRFAQSLREIENNRLRLRDKIKVCTIPSHSVTPLQIVVFVLVPVLYTVERVRTAYAPSSYGGS